MKEELQGKLVEILTSIHTAAGKASDFAMEQLPDVAQSYVMYGRVSSLAFALAGLAFVGLGCWLVCIIVQAYKKYNEERSKRESIYGGPGEPFGVAMSCGLGSLGAFIVGAALFLSNAQAAMLVWFAPKVWLLKEIASFLK